MEYLIILKKETNENIKKFNEIKKWLILNFNKNIKNIYFHYENKVNLNTLNSLNFAIIGPDVFPLLTSLPIPSNNSNFIIGNKNNCIASLKLLAPLISKKDDMKNINDVDFNIIWNVIKGIDKKRNMLKKFTENNFFDKEWFYTDNINYTLNLLEKKYFTWSNLNKIKLKIAHIYEKVIYYDGKNKFESKKIVEKLNINTPKTYKIFNNLNEINNDNINNLPYCIIKPTNWDGSKYIFKHTSNSLIDADVLKKKLSGFDSKNRNKELMPLISKTHKPKIIAEQYIKDLNGNMSSPCEFKFYVFDGKILFLLAINRKANYNKFDFYDENFVQIPNSKYSFERTQINFKWPKLPYFNELKKDVLKIYRKFNEDLLNSFLGRFVRIDFFVNKDSYWFGEFSLFPNGGSGKNVSEFGKKYFASRWLPEVFQILNKIPKEEKKKDLPQEKTEDKLYIDDLLPKKTDYSSRVRFYQHSQNNDRLVDFLFS